MKQKNEANRASLWKELADTSFNRRPAFFDSRTVREHGLIWDGKHLPYDPKTISYARQMRKAMTPHECKLWFDFLRDSPVRFLRQRSIGHYILDFYCAKFRIGIEVDGPQHADEDVRAYDDVRTKLLHHYGVTVIRFSNFQIDTQFEAVCRQIVAEVSRILNRI